MEWDIILIIFFLKKKKNILLIFPSNSQSRLGKTSRGKLNYSNSTLNEWRK